MGRSCPLPIDDVLSDVVAKLREHGTLVLEAPPGAGKTTRVPPALLDEVAGEIIVLEPRRLAARLSARRVAEERGEEPGQTIGYTVRFEDVGSARTRIRYVTEGVLTRRLVGDPMLRGVGAVVLDEFHERHLQGDFALALLRRLRRGPRPDLRLVVMSATLDAEPVARYLGAARVRSEGRRFDVAIEHADKPDERYLDVQVAAAVKRLVVEDAQGGDVLVFLPGAAEIGRAQRACADLAARHDLLLVPLYGDLSPAEQDRAVRPAAGRRKVILSTNVAETSITIEGVGGVVDAGLARVASHSPWTGIPSLRVQKVSQASAIQRAGRAGRTRAGRCLRLYTRHDFDTRPSHDAPEIRRLDLAELVLELHAAGVRDARTVEWFEPPTEASLDAAETLLARLGAVGGDGALTPLGRRLLDFPLHPRLARLLVEAEARGVGGDAAVIVAWLGEGGEKIERGRGGREQVSGPSDVLDALERFRADPKAYFQVDRARRQIERLLGRGGRRGAPPQDPDRELQVAILAGFPDRVARRRRAGAPELLLAAGGTAELADSSVVREAALVVVVDVEERGVAGGAPSSTRPKVRTASAIEADWLIDVAPDALRETRELRWNAASERVERVERLLYDQITLDEKLGMPGDDDADGAARVLAQAALAAGATRFGGGDGGAALARLRARLAFLAEAAPDAGFTPPDDAALAAALTERCRGASSFAELGAAPLHDALWEGLTQEQRRGLDQLAPERVALAGGRQVKVEYEPGKPPWIESRLQDFFGMSDGPRVARGRVAIVLHLLAPNQRAVQVTTDLAGFWDRHYPAIRKELMRKYPRHSWPEEPRVYTPPMTPKKPRT
jgi:ATP-dependent helicase HrpB